MRAVIWLIALIVALPAHAADEVTTRFQKFLTDEWDYTLREQPLLATRLGDLRFNDRLEDQSLEGARRHDEHARDALARLHAIDPAALDAADRLNYAIYLDQLDTAVAGQRFPDELMPLNQQYGFVRQLPDEVNVMPFRSTRHYEDYLKRLAQVPTAIDDTIAVLREGLRRGITPPREPLQKVSGQLQNQLVAKTEDSPFFAPFKTYPDTVSAADRTRFSQAGRTAVAESVLPAYRKLLAFWNDEYLPHTRTSVGLSALPDGAAWYAQAIRHHTTTTMTPQQIHELGLAEVKRIRAEMDAVMRATGFKGDFKEFSTFLRSDPRFYYRDPAALLTGYRDICKRIDGQLPRLFGHLPQNSYGVTEIPAYAAPTTTTAFYRQGSLAAGRAGQFFANTYRLETRPTWEMEALTLHESVPGHHLQISLAQELNGLPEFRRNLEINAFVEGWGLYAESLGPEIGMYQDPYSHFGQLTYEMWRAIRLVVDTGMHAFGWTRQQAIDYFMANSSKQEHDITVEVDRYISWPGQALAYKIGELKIKELRRLATGKLGDRFDIRAFHDVVLGSGAVPLSVLESNVKAWIAAQK